MYENKINRAIKTILRQQPTYPPLPPINHYQGNGPSIPPINQSSTTETKVPKHQEITIGIIL